MSLTPVLNWLEDWVDRWQERSWLVHGTVFLAIALPVWPVMRVLAGRPVAQACVAGVAVFLVRELEQIAHEIMGDRPAEPRRWLDHALDVLAPAIVGLVLSLIEAALR